MAYHDHRYKQQPPPSPPPSPSSTRRRHKKKNDPLEELARTPVPSRPGTPEDDSSEEESLITRIVLTPILFISFLISLFFVNYRNRARRAEAHSTATSILTYLTPSSWLDPEPYQDPHDSTWERKGATGHVEPNDAIGPREDEKSEGEKIKKKRKSWHLNKRIRKMAKLEISDAFEMRGRIIVGMVAIMIVGSVVLWMVAKRTLALLSQKWFDSKA